MLAILESKKKHKLTMKCYSNFNQKLLGHEKNSHTHIEKDSFTYKLVEASHLLSEFTNLLSTLLGLWTKLSSKIKMQNVFSSHYKWHIRM